MTSDDDDHIEVLRGAEAIARAINAPRRRVYALLEARALPAWKEIGVWTTTRARLREHYEERNHQS
jgi:hypothetical protein